MTLNATSTAEREGCLFTACYHRFFSSRFAMNFSYPSWSKADDTHNTHTYVASRFCALALEIVRAADAGALEGRAGRRATANAADGHRQLRRQEAEGDRLLWQKACNARLCGSRVGQGGDGRDQVAGDAARQFGEEAAALRGVRVGKSTVARADELCEAPSFSRASRSPEPAPRARSPCGIFISSFDTLGHARRSVERVSCTEHQIDT